MKRRFFSILFFIALPFLFSSCAKKNLENQKIERIVSLGPSATEILFAIGAGNQVVARTDFCDYPPLVLELPSVGGFSSANTSLESIISFEPDLVYLFNGIHNQLIKPLEELGIEVYVSDATSIKAVEDEILEVGKLTGHLRQAQEVVKEMQNELEQISLTVSNIKEKNPEKEFRLFWKVWDEPLISVGKKSFINDIILKSGWKNIFGELEESYPIVSQEAVFVAKPDYIVADESLNTRPSPRLVNTVRELSYKLIEFAKEN